MSSLLNSFFTFWSSGSKINKSSSLTSDSLWKFINPTFFFFFDENKAQGTLKDICNSEIFLSNLWKNFNMALELSWSRRKDEKWNSRWFHGMDLLNLVIKGLKTYDHFSRSTCRQRDAVSGSEEKTDYFTVTLHFLGRISETLVIYL